MDLRDLLNLVDRLPTDESGGMTLTDVGEKLHPHQNRNGAYRNRLDRWLKSLLAQGVLKCARKKTPRYWINKEHELVRRLTFSQDLLARAVLSAELFEPLLAEKNESSYRKSSIKALSGGGDERLAIFNDRIRVVPDGVHREPYEIDRDSIARAIDAMEKKKCIRLKYKEPNSEDRYGPVTEDCVLTVLGLALKDTTAYLIGRAMGDRTERVHGKLQYFNIKRCTDIEICESIDAEMVGVFDIDQFIKDHGNLSRVVDSEPMDLVLHVHPKAIFHFRERPFNKSQSIQELPDGTFLVKVRVLNTIQLEPFLWSHSPWVNVVSPPKYRHQVQQHIMRAFKRYLDLELAEQGVE